MKIKTFLSKTLVALMAFAMLSSPFVAFASGGWQGGHGGWGGHSYYGCRDGGGYGGLLAFLGFILGTGKF